MAGSIGGTGAIRQAFELARMGNPDVTVHVSDPTWPNHLSIMKFMGLPYVEYRYFDAATRGVRHHDADRLAGPIRGR